MKKLFRLYLFIMALIFASFGVFAQDSSCIVSVRKFCQFLKEDSFSKGPLNKPDSLYLNRVLDGHFNVPLVKSYYNQDTSLYNAEAKFLILQGAILSLDAFLDETDWNQIKFTPAFRKGQIDSMDAEDKRVYDRAMNIELRLLGVWLNIGMALFDDRCRMSGYLFYGFTVEEAEVIKAIYYKRRNLEMR